MKKLLAFLLVFTMVFAFTACGGEDETSNSSSQASSATNDTSSKASSAANSSAAQTSESKADSSSVASSKETSSASSSASTSSGTSSGTTSGGTSTDAPKFTNKYVSFGGDITTTVRADQDTSIRLTKINKAVVAGDVALFTKAFGKNLTSGSETYKDFAVLVCTYDHSIFGYKKTSLVDNDSNKASTAIPADGFVIAVAKSSSEYKKLKGIKDTDKFFPHGIQIGDQSIKLIKAKKAPTIDGTISAAEYGTALWKINENNKLWDYSQFEKNNYYVTGEVYATYDDNNFYLGVIVSSPENYCPLTPGDPGSMWKYYCIQVNLYSVDPLGDYISEHYDHVIDTKAKDDGNIRQYGFGVNEKNETLSTVWMGIDSKFTGQVKVVRDDNAQKTYYEVAIPWNELGTKDKPFSIKGVNKVGFALSINCTNEDDVKASKWKNLKMRDGGGIIGRNDFSKGASVTLG